MCFRVVIALNNFFERITKILAGFASKDCVVLENSVNFEP